MALTHRGTAINSLNKSMLLHWFFDMATYCGCNPMQLITAFGTVDDPKMPDFVVMKDNRVKHHIPNTRQLDGDAVAFLISNNARRVFAFDISYLPVRNSTRVFQLPEMRAIGRHIAFNRLSDAIEATSSVLSDAKYKELYDAAKSIYSRGKAAISGRTA